MAGCKSCGGKVGPVKVTRPVSSDSNSIKTKPVIVRANRKLINSQVKVKFVNDLDKHRA